MTESREAFMEYVPYLFLEALKSLDSEAKAP